MPRRITRNGRHVDFHSETSRPVGAYGQLKGSNKHRPILPYGRLTNLPVEIPDAQIQRDSVKVSEISPQIHTSGGQEEKALKGKRSFVLGSHHSSNASIYYADLTHVERPSVPCCLQRNQHSHDEIHNRN
jgi:hypothetical protein